MARPFIGQAAYEHVDARLACIVASLWISVGDDARKRACRDDVSSLARDHMSSCRLRGKEDALEVHVHQAVPLLLGHIFGVDIDSDAGVGHHDINFPPALDALIY